MRADYLPVLQFQKPEDKTCKTCGQWLSLSERTEMLCHALGSFAAWLNDDQKGHDKQ